MQRCYVPYSNDHGLECSYLRYLPCPNNEENCEIVLPQLPYHYRFMEIVGDIRRGRKRRRCALLCQDRNKNGAVIQGHHEKGKIALMTQYFAPVLVWIYIVILINSFATLQNQKFVTVLLEYNLPDHWESSLYPFFHDSLLNAVCSWHTVHVLMSRGGSLPCTQS